MGRLLRLKQRDPKTGKSRDSKFWYILYYSDGRQIRENTKTNDYTAAVNMLAARRKDSVEGRQPVSDVKKLRFEDLRDGIRERLGAP